MLKRHFYTGFVASAGGWKGNGWGGGADCCSTASSLPTRLVNTLQTEPRRNRVTSTSRCRFTELSQKSVCDCGTCCGAGLSRVTLVGDGGVLLGMSGVLWVRLVLAMA